MSSAKVSRRAQAVVKVIAVPQFKHCAIVRADLVALAAIVGLPSASSLSPHRLQGRLAVLLSMVLCLWMFASATHFHVAAEDLSGDHSTVDLCGFCASVPSTGAAPALSVFVPTAERQHVAAPAEILPAALTPTTASYRSRAPPTV